MHFLGVIVIFLILITYIQPRYCRSSFILYLYIFFCFPDIFYLKNSVCKLVNSLQFTEFADPFNQRSTGSFLLSHLRYEKIKGND